MSMYTHSPVCVLIGFTASPQSHAKTIAVELVRRIDRIRFTPNGARATYLASDGEHYSVTIEPIYQDLNYDSNYETDRDDCADSSAAIPITA